MILNLGFAFKTRTSKFGPYYNNIMTEKFIVSIRSIIIIFDINKAQFN